MPIEPQYPEKVQYGGSENTSLLRRVLQADFRTSVNLASNLAGEGRQLGGESALVGRPRFAAGNIGREVRIGGQNAR